MAPAARRRFNGCPSRKMARPAPYGNRGRQFRRRPHPSSAALVRRRNEDWRAIRRSVVSTPCSNLMHCRSFSSSPPVARPSRSGAIGRSTPGATTTRTTRGSAKSARRTLVVSRWLGPTRRTMSSPARRCRRTPSSSMACSMARRPSCASSHSMPRRARSSGASTRITARRPRRASGIAASLSPPIV